MTAITRSIQAASALVVRDGIAGIEVLLVRRAGASRAFAGLWVFPGGKLDAADCALAGATAARPEHSTLPPELWAHGIAGWREIIEETAGDPALGHDVARVRTMLARAVYFAHWHAPRASAHTPFDTRFFLLDAALLPHHPAPDGHETTELRWLTPAAALAAAGSGAMALAPPTAFNLLELAAAAGTADSTTALLARESDRAVLRIQPRLQRRGEQWFAVFPWDAEFAALSHADESEDAPRIPDRYRAFPSRFKVRDGIVLLDA